MLNRSLHGHPRHRPVGYVEVLPHPDIRWRQELAIAKFFRASCLIMMRKKLHRVERYKNNIQNIYYIQDLTTALLNVIILQGIEYHRPTYLAGGDTFTPPPEKKNRPPPS